MSPRERLGDTTWAGGRAGGELAAAPPAAPATGAPARCCWRPRLRHHNVACAGSRPCRCPLLLLMLPLLLGVIPPLPILQLLLLLLHGLLPTH